MSISIVQVSSVDYPVLQAIEQDAEKSFLDVGYDFCVGGQTRDREEFERGLKDGALFVAEHEGEAIGFALLWRVDQSAHLTELSVVRNSQGSGIGSALISASEEWARGSGFAEITLTTFRDVSWNAPAYERRGFCVFHPDRGRPELIEIMEQEVQEGLAVEPRVAMIKTLI